MPQSPIRQHYPSQHYLSSDRRLGDKRPSQSVPRVGADASLPHKPHSTGQAAPKTTESGHHLCAYKRTHYGGHYPRGGGRGPGGPRHGEDAGSVCSSKSSTRSASAPRDPKTMSSPKHGFSRTHDGGYWGKKGKGPSSTASTRSGSSTGSIRRFPKNKTELNVREDEMDRIKGFSRKTNGGYWKDRRHLDPAPMARSQSEAPSSRWEPEDQKLWTPRAAYTRKKAGEFYRAEHEKGAQVKLEYKDAPEIFSDKAADPMKPKPGYTRTYWGSYYRDPDNGIGASDRTAQTSAAPCSGFSRTPMGGFYRGGYADSNEGPTLNHPSVLPDQEADPGAPGPGFTRTNYGGFFMKDKQSAE